MGHKVVFKGIENLDNFIRLIVSKRERSVCVNEDELMHLPGVVVVRIQTISMIPTVELRIMASGEEIKKALDIVKNTLISKDIDVFDCEVTDM